jgi:Trypsin-like peptidase domain
MIVCPKTSFKGTGFLVDDGTIISNEHVVRGCAAADVTAVSSFGHRVTFSALRVDAGRDLAALTPSKPIRGGLPLGSTAKLEVGSVVRTWGHPLGYNGPAPLLSVGYLSGFRAQQAAQNPAVKHLVVNAAFNSGNSGGPLFAGSENQVVGVVVNKALPLFTPFVQSAVQAFSNNKSGIVFTGTDADGKPLSMVESQVVAEIVASLRDMAQVMIGEAIAVEEVKAFLAYKGSGSKQ